MESKGSCHQLSHTSCDIPEHAKRSVESQGKCELQRERSCNCPECPSGLGPTESRGITDQLHETSSKIPRQCKRGMESQGSSHQLCETGCSMPKHSTGGGGCGASSGDGGGGDSDHEPVNLSQVNSQPASSSLVMACVANQSDGDSASDLYPGSRNCDDSVDAHDGGAVMSDGSDANSGGDVYVVNGSDDSESGYSSDSLNSLEVSPVVDFFVDVNTQETVTANWLRSPRVLYSQLRTTGTMMMVVVVVVGGVVEEDTVLLGAEAAVAVGRSA